MKNFTLQKLGTVALFLLCGTLLLSAQEKKSANITVVKKVIREDGSTAIEKKELTDEEDLISHFKKLQSVDGKEMEIHLMDASGEDANIEGEGETMIFIRSAAPNGEDASKIKADLEKFQLFWHDKAGTAPMSGHDPCRVFIGVGTTDFSAENKGLRVNYTVENTPATAAGVQAGDIILALDDAPINSQQELLRERNKHQPGDTFKLTILRDGNTMTINARFKECSEAEMQQSRDQQEAKFADMQAKMEKMHSLMEQRREGLVKIEKSIAQISERPILGIYVDEFSDAKGLTISDVSADKGAAAAGLKSGDVITSVEGKPITNAPALRDALSSFKAGDKVTVQYLRNGSPATAVVSLSTAQNIYSWNVERDPCAVFIGVYTSDRGVDGQGVRVTGIIEDTPAKLSGVLAGDVILALDDAPVNNHLELRQERDKHKPGELFTLSVMRNGTYLEIEAQFKSCDQTAQEAKTPVEEVVVMEEKEAATPAQETTPQLNLDTQLKLDAWSMYPNPTFGLLNVRFQGEAVPTILQISDLAGKVIYREALNQFDGYYDQQLNLNGTIPGTYILTVQQGDKALSKKVVLMPKV